MDRVYGVVVGIVLDVDDPEEQGRVKLRFPWLAEDGAESGWAPIARPLAGNDRGFFYQPEVDDEALVAFEHGDVNHPMVLGFLHNGVDLPPYQKIDKHVRRLKSVAGHVLELDDRSGGESVRLHSNGGHQLELHDASGYVELVTAGHQRLRMQDQPGRITLSTTSGTTVTIDDVPSQVEVRTATGGTVLISAAGAVTVTAPTTVTVTGTALQVNTPIAQFSGILQCSTLITNAVVSSVYTPGAGNLW